MNCTEFKWSLVDTVDFNVRVEILDGTFYLFGLIHLTVPTYISKRSKLCEPVLGPRHYDEFCNRWAVWFGTFYNTFPYDGNYWLNVDEITPTISKNSFQWPVSQSFKPWNENDPFYARAVDVWNARDEAYKQFSFSFAYDVYGSTAVVVFNEAKDGEDCLILKENTEEVIGNATLTIKMR